MQYTVIELFQSETEEERRRNLERLLQQLRPINGPKDGGTDAPRKSWAAVSAALSKEEDERKDRARVREHPQPAGAAAGLGCGPRLPVFIGYTQTRTTPALTVRGPASTRCWPTRGRANLRLFWQKRSRGSPVTWSW